MTTRLIKVHKKTLSAAKITRIFIDEKWRFQNLIRRIKFLGIIVKRNKSNCICSAQRKLYNYAWDMIRLFIVNRHLEQTIFDLLNLNRISDYF